MRFENAVVVSKHFGDIILQKLTAIAFTCFRLRDIIGKIIVIRVALIKRNAGSLVFGNTVLQML